jgi:hypothetical protein
MPHDQLGNLLKEGDDVVIPARIKKIHPHPDYCNVDVELTFTMPPEGSVTTLSAINTSQLLKKANHNLKEVK